jgi:hypothetical protein
MAASHRWPRQPHRRTGLGRRAHDGRFGEVRPSQPEVCRLEGAGLAGGLGLCQQTHGSSTAVAHGLRNPLGSLGQGGRLLQPPLAAVQVKAVDGPQQPGRIEDVGQPVLVGVGVTVRVRQHRAYAELVGQGHGARGRPQRARTGALTAQMHAFQAQPLTSQLPPRREQLLGDVGAACGQGPHRLGRGPEQHHQVLVGVLAQDRPGHDRQSSVRLGVRGGTQTAQPRPPRHVLCKQADPQWRLHHVRAAAYRRTWPSGSRGLRDKRSDGDVDAENRTGASGRCGLGEADRPRDGVPVGQREGRHAVLGRALDEDTGRAAP